MVIDLLTRTDAENAYDHTLHTRAMMPGSCLYCACVLSSTAHAALYPLIKDWPCALMIGLVGLSVSACAKKPLCKNSNAKGHFHKQYQTNRME